MKIITVLGARPQFIKAALLSRELRRNHREILVHTGQHYDRELSNVFFEELNIPQPDYNLGIGSATQGKQTGQMMIEIEKLLIIERPDLVLVYGDTNSTLAAALAAVKLHVPVAHVEAGPRMFDKSVPEEINRIITDHISTLLFAPTQISLENLRKEGLTRGVYLTGDVMLDNFYYFSGVAEKHSRILEQIGLQKGKYILVTVHRARNTDIEGNLKNICAALSIIAKREKLVFPVHPRTEKFLKQYGFWADLEREANITLIKPVGYLDMLVLTKGAKKILTDSGGLQKEAYFAGVPCITLDITSGWPETVADGWNLVVGECGDSSSLDIEKIVRAAFSFAPKGERQMVFGDGRAVEKICAAIDGFKC